MCVNKYIILKSVHLLVFLPEFEIELLILPAVKNSLLAELISHIIEFINRLGNPLMEKELTKLTMY
jgi:hypothetical protein